MGGKTTTQSSEPWSAAKPALQQTLTDAGKLYGSGIGAGIYTGPTSAPMSHQQLRGNEMLSDTARGYDQWLHDGKHTLNSVSNSGNTNPNMLSGQNTVGQISQGVGAPSIWPFEDIGNKAQNDPYAGTFSSLTGQAQNDPFRRQFSTLGNKAQADPFLSAFGSLANQAGSNPYQSNINSLLSGAADPNLGKYGQIANSAQASPYLSQFADVARAAGDDPSMRGWQEMAAAPGMSMTEQNLNKVASGGMLSGADPYFEDVLSTASRKAQDAVNLQASGMGRSNSGANYGNVAREIGELQTQARSNQYNTERGRQVEANQLIDLQRNTGNQLRQSGLSGLGNAYGNRINQQLSAIGAGSNAYQAGLGQALNANQAGSAAYGAGQDRLQNATGLGINTAFGGLDRALAANQAGTNAYQSGLSQALNAGQAGSNSFYQGQGQALNAASAGSNANRSGLDQALAAFGQSAGLQGQNLDRRLGAANSLFNMGQQGVNNQLSAFDRMGQQFQYGQMPGQLMRDVGSQYQTQAQNVLDDQIRMFDAAQSAPWDQLGRYNAIAQGMGGLGGTQTQRQSQGLGGFLGNMISLAGML